MNTETYRQYNKLKQELNLLVTTHCVDSINLTKHPDNIIKMAKPTQDLKLLHISLTNDLIRMYKMCLFLDKQHPKYYSVYWNIHYTLAFLNRVEIYLTDLIVFQFMEFQFKYCKLHKQYKKIYNKRFRYVKKCYREYYKEFSKTEKKFNKVYSKINEEEKKKSLNLMNMNTVYSEIVENTYKSMCVSDPEGLTELVEGVTLTGIVTPQEEEDTVKEILKSRI